LCGVKESPFLQMKVFGGTTSVHCLQQVSMTLWFSQKVRGNCVILFKSRCKV